jgi:XRE family transcriptional regulator of biofilm formation
MPHEPLQPSIESLGARIRRLRKERGLAQDRLALRANVDQSGLSKFERNRDRSISRQALERIAAVLGLSYDALVTGTDWHSGDEG